MAVKQLIVEILGNATKFNQSMGQASASAGKFNNVLSGIGAGLGIGGMLGVAAVTSKVVDVMGDAVAAAVAEEASIAKLGTALQANVKDWDGNTEAIERVLKARMDLGFSDDEQRDSLARAVVATNDVTKALDVQRAAMDLARLKGISLGEATDALIKVEGGQFRALKALGIELPKNASATEALAAVTKAAAGQAEAYAETSGGKLLVSQVKLGEAMEQLGGVALPLVVEGMSGLADIVTGVSTSFDLLNGKMPTTAEETQEAWDAITGLTAALGTFVPGMNVAALAMENMDADTRAMTGSSNNAGKAVDDLGNRTEDLAETAEESAEATAQSFEDMKNDIVRAANDAIDAAYDPLIEHERLLATESEIAAQRRILASNTATAKEKANARSALTSAQKDLAETLVKLAEAGATNSKAYANGIAELKKNIATAKGPAKAALQEILNKILEVERAGKVVPINVKVVQSGSLNGIPLGRASGGPVRARHMYEVNEDTPNSEFFVPDQDGTILTRAQGNAMMGGAGSGMALGGGGGGGLTIVVQGSIYGVDGVDQLADVVVRRMRTLGAWA